MDQLVFTSSTLAGIKLKNKIIRSATHEGLADENGFPTEKLKQLYVRLAKGDVGAIITGYAGIDPQGKSHYYGMLMIDKDESIPFYKEIVDTVHENQTPIILQIAHCGRQTRSKVTGFPPVAPSGIRDKFFKEEKPQALTSLEIDVIIEQFVAGIVRARRAGFDGVQLHMAHGYLLSQFLSPYMNRRLDQWGGSTENRFRIISEIYKRAQAVVGSFPIFAKINGYDGRKYGMKIEEAVRIAKMLEIAGCAGIEVSCGIFEDGFFMIRGSTIPVEAVFKHNFQYQNLAPILKFFLKKIANIIASSIKPLKSYNVPAAKAIKKAVAIPVIVVGGIHSLSDVQGALAQKAADFVSMSRPFIIEPNIVRKFKEGKQEESKCILCNHCAIILEKSPLKCYAGRI